MAHDVFICHSAKDKTTADAVCAGLEANGVRCWIAPRDVTPGMEWSECIIDAIEECRIMVLVFTTHANESPQIRREIERAVNRGVAILPLRIEDILPGRALEYFIGNVHWLDALTPPLENHLNNLAGTVKLLLARMPRHELNLHPLETPFTPHAEEPAPPKFEPAKSVPEWKEEPTPKPFATPATEYIPPKQPAEVFPRSTPEKVDPVPPRPQAQPPIAPAATSVPQTQTGKRKLHWGIYVVSGLSAIEGVLWIVGLSSDLSSGRFASVDLLAILGAVVGGAMCYGLFTLKQWARYGRILCSAAEVVLMIAVAQDAFREGGFGLFVWFTIMIGSVWIVWYLLSARAREAFRTPA